MAEIAVMVLSPIVQAFFDKMASGQFVDFFRRRKLNNDLLVRLKIKLRSVNAVLKDAEDKQFTMPKVKEWVDDVYDVVYDAEQVLDEISTKAQQRELDAESETFGSKVRNSIATSRFVKKVERQMQKLLDMLEFLVNEKENLGLREGVGGNPSERLPSTSLVDESRIFGRHDVKEAVFNSLLSDGAFGDKMGVIAIVGMGGIGKTTLAQLVYNDDRLNEHFDHKAWVCVSDDFDVLKLTKTIVEKVTEETFDTNDLDQLQRKLKEKLMKKKFLIVLDDVWNKELKNWELLSVPFNSVAQGSRLILTTRDQGVIASTMLASKTYPLNELPNECCWSLFAKYAFQDVNLHAYPQLEEIGRQIVYKCKGLPLAIKAIGALLRSNLDINEWNKVLRSGLWDSQITETSIIPALKLSYQYLSPPLRRCFAYCSIFPKDHVFKKDDLVFLWMAEGFLPQPQNKTMKEVGDDYFLALVSRSLFQLSKHNEYVMHDLVNDLTKFISKEFTLCQEDDSSREILSKTRHFSFSSTKFDIKKFETCHEAKRLRTIVKLNYRGNLFINSETKFLLPKISCLRVLILSHCQDLSELPDAIGTFKQLRYLNLIATRIKRLPDSICKLFNLQILNLSSCRSLVAWPRDLHKLIHLQILDLSHCEVLAALPRDLDKLSNLHHLDITGTRITEMPINLGKLKCLRTLPTFIVSKHGGSGIEEIGKLTNLQESLSILQLQNVESPVDAKDLYLRDKYLKELELMWSVDTSASKSLKIVLHCLEPHPILGSHSISGYGGTSFPNWVGGGASESQKIVLHCLEPHPILGSLTISGYGGTSFPNWVGDASFSNITSLYLDNCKFCCSLPPLGQLSSMQHLSIVGLDGVVTVGRQFYGSGSSSMKPFGALRFLRFEKMLEWKEWFPFEAENEGGAFPMLRELRISNCPKLTGGLPVHLPSLAELFIHNCPQLVASRSGASSLRKLTVENCNTFLLNKLSSGTSSRRSRHEMTQVRLSNCNTVTLNESSIGIHELRIENCKKILLKESSFGTSSRHEVRLSNCNAVILNESSIGIHELIIENCKTFLLEESSSGTSSRHELTVLDCNTVILNESSIGMHALSIENCSMLEFPMHLNYSSLEYLTLDHCSSLKSCPLFSKIRKLVISNCGDLESFTVGEQHEHDLLSVIDIYNCPNFAYLPQGGLRAPNLKIFSIWDCRSLRSLPDKMHELLPSLEKLHINDCPQVESFPEGGLPSSLKEIYIFNSDKLFANRMGYLNYSSLEYLKLKHCSSLKSIPLFSNIRQLVISDCGDLESLTVGEQHEHDLLLSRMAISRCPNFAYFPQGGLRAPNLKDFSIEDCRSLRSLPDKMHELLPSLEKLYINGCPQVESFPEGGLPSKLNDISIFNSDKLFANRMGWGLQNLSFVRRFSTNGNSKDVESFPDEGLLPTTLTYLYISGFPNLKSLEKKGFQHLTALKELIILQCPKLQFLPEDGLPASLYTIKIYSSCPLLMKELKREEGPEWDKIARVPNKNIYYPLL